MFHIPEKFNCALLAFGAGALLFALTIEIFGEALFAYQSDGSGIFLKKLTSQMIDS